GVRAHPGRGTAAPGVGRRGGQPRVAAPRRAARVPTGRRAMGRIAGLIVAALLAVGSVGSAAHAEPSDERLVLTGLAMVPPTYLLGVTFHEGSHALAAKLVGGTVREV